MSELFLYPNENEELPSQDFKIAYSLPTEEKLDYRHYEPTKI